MNTITYRSLLLGLVLCLFGFQPSTAQVGVELPQITADAGEDIAIPVRVDTLDGKDITSYQFTLPYDSSVLNIADSVTTDGTLTPGNAQIQVGSDPGEIRVSVANDAALSGSGDLITLHATLVGAGTAPLSFSNFQLFDSEGAEVESSLTDGEVVSEALTVSLPSRTVDVGTSISIPIDVDSLDGRDVTSYQFTLPYDSTVIDISGIDTEGTLTPAGADVEVATDPGEIRVSVAADEVLTGAGTLVSLNATVTDAGTAPLSFSSFALFDTEGDEVLTDAVDGEIVGQGIVVTLPDVTAEAGDSLSLPVDIEDLGGAGVTSYQFTLPYDASILDISGVNTTGTITSSSADIEVSADEGEIRVSVAAEDSLSGSGALINLDATLVGAGTAPLSFSSFQLFDRDANEVATTLRDGQVVSEALTVRLPDVTRSVGSSLNLPISTDSLDGKTVTSYQFTLPYDASVLNIGGVETEGTLTPSSADIQVATETGEIRVSVATDQPLEGAGTLLKLSTTLEGEGTAPLSFSNFQLFNQDGNEVITTTVDGEVVSQGVLISLPNRSGDVGQMVPVPITADSLEGKDVSSYQFTLPYDASVVSFSDSVTTEGTLTPSDATIEVNASSGEISVSVAADAPFDADGTLLQLNATAVDKGETNLDFSNFELFDTDGTSVAATLRGGMFTTTGVDIRLPNVVTALDAGSVRLPIGVEPIDEFNITAYQFTLPYDANIVTIDTVTTDGTVTPSTADVQIRSEQGEIRVSVATDQPLTGEGTLLNLEATLEGGGTSVLSFSDLQLFDQDGNGVASSPQDGSIAVAEASAQAQWIHNAADPAADTVDIYFEDQLRFDDVEFRTATEFLDVPAGVGFTVGIAGAESQSVADTMASQEVQFSENQNYTVVANGVADPSSFAANPDGQNIGLRLLRRNQAQLAGTVDSDVDLRSVHGGTDAPTIDLSAGGTTLFSDLTYGAISGYTSVGASGVELVISESSSGDEVASFQAPLSDLGGAAATVVASGFLDPAANQEGAGFALLLVEVDGTVTVLSQNSPPEFTSVPSDATVEIGETLTLQVEATDPEGEDVTYSLLENPDNSSIGSTSGEFTFTPAFSQRGSTFAVTVQASDGEATADTSFSVTAELDRQPITVNINQGFGDATVQSNYRLVGLPGQVGLAIDETVQGESGADNAWRAFWDDGSSSTQAGLIEFDGSSQFDFQPGRGFWLLARNPWSVSGTFDPVPLDNDGNATISVHDGWNIISNPLGKTISWSSVQDVNGISNPLWSFSAGFSQASGFGSAQQGEAFYFLNDQGLSDLQVPYVESSNSSETKNPEGADVRVVQLSTVVEEETTSSVALGLRTGAKEGEDRFDHFAPPNYFEKAALRAVNEDINSKYKLASDLRPIDSDGQTFELSLEAEPGSEVMVTAKGLSTFQSNEHIRLFDSGAATSYDLRNDPTIEIRPESEKRDFVVMIGSESYVKSKQSELAPQKVKLHQNYPNPFREQTTLRYAVPEEMDVRLEVYDLLGRRVETLVDGRMTAGVHTLQWSGDTRSGQQLASGTYLVRLQAGDQMRTMKMVLVK